MTTRFGLLLVLTLALLANAACSDKEEGSDSDSDPATAGATNGSNRSRATATTRSREATPTRTRETPTTRPGEATATRSPGITPSATATQKPGGTGVKSVDDAIAAVAANDAARLTALIHFWPKPCTQPLGIGALPCPSGSAVGTPVMVVGVGSCEGSFFKSGDPAIAAAVQTVLSRERKMYAVVIAPTFASDPTIAGKYQIVYEPGLVLSVDDQGITYFKFPCGEPNAAAVISSGRYGANPSYLVKP